MNQAMKGEPFTIFGDGEQTRAFSHIDDVAPLIARSIERPMAYNQIFNVGADMPYSINHLAHVVANAMDVPLQTHYLDARNEVVHAFSSHEKVQALFQDLVQNIGLEEGVQRMAAWAKQHGSRETKPFTDIEVAKHMPTSWAAFQHV